MIKKYGLYTLSFLNFLLQELVQKSLKLYMCMVEKKFTYNF